MKKLLLLVLLGFTPTAFAYVPFVGPTDDDEDIDVIYGSAFDVIRIPLGLIRVTEFP